MAGRLLHDEPAPAAEVDSAEEEARIQRLAGEWIGAITRKDPAGLTALLSDRAVMLPPNADSIKGRDEISRAWEALLELPGFTATFEPHRTNVYPTGDVAHDISRYRLAWDGPNGDRVRDHGNHLIVWERNGDGEAPWKVRSNVFYSKSVGGSSPLAAGPRLEATEPPPGSPPGEDLVQHDEDRHHEQDVDQPFGDLEHDPPEKPEHQDDHRDDPGHVYLPS